MINYTANIKDVLVYPWIREQICKQIRYKKTKPNKNIIEIMGIRVKWGEFQIEDKFTFCSWLEKELAGW